jgi:hypothetical protein
MFEVDSTADAGRCSACARVSPAAKLALTVTPRVRNPPGAEPAGGHWRSAETAPVQQRTQIWLVGQERRNHRADPGPDTSRPRSAAAPPRVAPPGAPGHLTGQLRGLARDTPVAATTRASAARARWT